MMRGYLDRMLRPRDVQFRFHAGPISGMGASGAACDGMLVTSEALTKAEICALRAYMEKQPILVDGQIVTVPRSVDRTPLKIW